MSRLADTFSRIKAEGKGPGLVTYVPWRMGQLSSAPPSEPWPLEPPCRASWA